MNKLSRMASKIMLILFACILALFFAGCEGSDARKTITDTVKEAAGQKVVEKSEKMKKDIDQAMKEEAKRLINMDKQKQGDESGNDSKKESDE